MDSERYEIIRDEEQPMHCWVKGCKEDLNALNVVLFHHSEDFIFQLALCDKCLNKFKYLEVE